MRPPYFVHVQNTILVKPALSLALTPKTNNVRGRGIDFANTYHHQFSRFETRRFIKS